MAELAAELAGFFEQRHTNLSHRDTRAGASNRALIRNVHLKVVLRQTGELCAVV